MTKERDFLKSSRGQIGGALYRNITGNGPTAIGDSALFNNTGTSNTALGAGAGGNVTTVSNVIAIRSPGANVNDSCYIGNIFGGGAISGDAVFITSAGKLGTVTIPSAARFKDEIKPMNKASEALFGLKPVTFHYKHEFDPHGIPQFGWVAEEVEKVNPDLVKRDRDGKLQAVRYDAVNAMLLNEFLKEHKKVEEQQATIAELKSTVAHQQKEFQTAVAEQRREIERVVAHLKEQDTRIQRVNDELEMNGTARQVVANKP
ncbi:MAG TPA: tail fiber domain-containing protein [Candidatus Udaeobacter sp.]